MKLKSNQPFLFRPAVVSVIVVFIFILSAAGSFKTIAPLDPPADSLELMLPDSIIIKASELKGIKYRYGGMDLSGFDCSGFTSFVYKMFDIILPHSSREQYKLGAQINPEEIRKADLLFFKGRSLQSKHVGHVGIAVSDWENGNVYFIHASSLKGIKIDSLRSSYYKPRFIGASRIIYSNPIRLAKPLLPNFLHGIPQPADR